VVIAPLQPTSPLTTLILLFSVIQAGKELGVTVLGYSPLGRGFLVNDYKSGTEFKDFRARVPRLAPGAFEANLKIKDSLTKISTKLGITNAQLCLAWVASLGMSKMLGELKNWN